MRHDIKISVRIDDYPWHYTSEIYETQECRISFITHDTDKEDIKEFIKALKRLCEEL